MGVFLALAIYWVIIDLTIGDQQRARKSIMGGIGLIVVLALRSPFCGVDLLSNESYSEMSYYGTFRRLSEVGLSDIIHNQVLSHYEIGFQVLTKLITYLTHNFQIYLLIIAILQCVPIIYILKKHSSNIILSYFIYGGLGLFVFSFSGLRQTIAISITLLAFDALCEKKNIHFLLLTSLAFLFHKSAIVFFLIWPLSKFKISFSRAIIIFILLLALLPYYSVILKNLVDVLWGAGAAYESYLNEGGVALTMFFVYMILFLLSYYNTSASTANPSYKMTILRWLVLLGVICQSLGATGAGSITRIGFQFTIFFSLLLPATMMLIKKDQNKKIVKVVSIVLLCTFFYLVNRGGYLDVVPYYFVWEKPLL